MVTYMKEVAKVRNAIEMAGLDANSQTQASRLTTLDTVGRRTHL